MPKEQVTIVNEDDVVIGTKTRDDLTQQDIVRVSVLWIEDGRNHVLLQQRALTKKIGPGQWGPAVAGTVEAHETYISNIIKEAEEEINLTAFTPVEIGKRMYLEPDGHFGRMFMFYKAVVDKPITAFTIKEDEVAQIAWVPKESLITEVENHPRNYVPSAVFWKEMYY